jgi:hypothetical protein
MEEHSFDALAKEMADGTISRGQALKLVGGAVLGAFGLAALPGIAEAKKKKKKKKKKHPSAGVSPSLPPCTLGQTGCPTTCSCQGQCLAGVCVSIPLGPPPPGTLPPCTLLQTGCPTTCTCQGTCLAGICISLGGGGLP